MLGVLKSIFWSLFRRLVIQSPVEADFVALHHQVTMLQCQLGHQLKLTRWDRLLFATLYHIRPDVVRSISIMRPETVVQWHRQAFASSGRAGLAAKLDGRVC